MNTQESASEAEHMPAASRPARRGTLLRAGVPVAAAAALAGGAAVIVSLHGGSAVPVSAVPVSAAAAGDAMAVRSAGPGVTGSRMITAVHRAVAVLEERAVRRASTARRRHLAVLAAARLAQERAAQERAAQERAAQQAARQRAQAAAALSPPSPGPAPGPAPPPAPPGPGGDAASSALGICIRNAEEGGSYAWGPGNGGGAYQFVLGTWEAYGGAGGEYGVAGAAYQDQVFDHAIAAGGASNWTDYDGC
jgi:hypothetical protein